MTRIRLIPGVVVTVVIGCVAASPSISEDTAPVPPFQAQPFQAHVDMKTFMEHVLSPAARIIWTVNGLVIDEKGEHDLSPNRMTTGSRS
jgi:hypothetical protein